MALDRGGLAKYRAGVAAPTPPTRARRAWLLATGLIVALGLGLAPVAAAPGVAATCERVVGLVEDAGEPVDAAGRSACEARYTQLREARGWFGWAGLAWCTRWADSVDEAGEC